MYNFALAFLICAVAFVIGEAVSTVSKAWIPSVFVTAIVFLLGYWTIFPHDLVSDSVLIPFASTIGIYLLITHMGTVISLKQLIEQWKTILICLFGLLGMCLLSFFIAPMIIDRTLVIAGLPPLTGGIVAATMMKDAAEAAGLKTAAIFAIAMYCIQGFAGYPITAICLKKEGNRLLADYRSGKIRFVKEEKEENPAETAAPKKKLLPPLPDKYNTPVVTLGKLALVGWVATQLGAHTPVNGAIWALVLGIFFTTIGFLEPDSLHKANSFNIIMFALMMYVFDGLKDCTPEILGEVIVPMIVLIVIGVVGMGFFAFIISRILKKSFAMSFANCLTALYGFPCDAIITESTCTSLAANEEEKEFLMSQMFPSMIVSGFTTVTITSVFIAGIFAKML